MDIAAESGRLTNLDARRGRTERKTRREVEGECRCRMLRVASGDEETVEKSLVAAARLPSRRH